MIMIVCLQLILNAKCHAIRDAQILEREQIKREMEEEEKRLDQMMELDRVNAIDVDETIESKRKQERLLGAMKVMEQIQENEQVGMWHYNLHLIVQVVVEYVSIVLLYSKFPKHVRFNLPTYSVNFSCIQI